MDSLFDAANWGSPVGLGLFFFLSSAGLGVLFWGLSRLNKNSDDD